jgi:ribosomal protein S18 acetylase RimI-like enzyme
MTSIRYYNDNDYAEVKQVLQEGDLYDDVWEDRQNLKRKIKRDPQSILVAEDNKQIVGCVFIVEDGWNAFIWRLSIRKNHRKKGIGLLLMQKAEEIIKSRGIKESSLFVDTKKDSLKEWYQKQKYIKTSDFTFMYKKLKDRK